MSRDASPRLGTAVDIMRRRPSCRIRAADMNGSFHRENDRRRKCPTSATFHGRTQTVYDAPCPCPFSADDQLQLGCAKDMGLMAPSRENPKKRQRDCLDEVAVRVRAGLNPLNVTGTSLHTRRATCARCSSRPVPTWTPRSKLGSTCLSQMKYR